MPKYCEEYDQTHTYNLFFWGGGRTQFKLMQTIGITDNLGS